MLLGLLILMLIALPVFVGMTATDHHIWGVIGVFGVILDIFGTALVVISAVTHAFLIG